MRLRPEMLESAYAYLRTTQPFRSHKLPDPDDLEFRITRHRDRYGHFDDGDDERDYRIIAISEIHVKTGSQLIETMAHEIAHLVLHQQGCREWDDHGRAFQALARMICRAHGFEMERF